MTLLKGKAILKSEDVKPGDMLETRLYDGKIMSKAEITNGKDGKRKN